MRALALFLFALPALAQTAGSAMPFVKPQFFTNTGQPAAGYKLCAFASGTTSPILTYTTSALNVPNSNPVVLDSSGRAAVFMSPVSYKFALLLPSSTTTDCVNGTMSAIWTQDNIANNADLLKAALAASTGANLIGYKGNGNVSTTVGAVLSSAFSYDSTFSTAALACASAVTVAVTKQTLWNALSTQTCAAPLWFPTGTGVSIQPASGQTVTLAGAISAPPTQQIFDTSLGGAGSIALPAGTTAQVGWFGTNALAIQSALSSGSLHVAAACGTYALTTTSITIPSTALLLVDFPCATFTYSGTGVAFATAAGATNQTINIGAINRTTETWPAGTDTSSVGIKLTDTKNGNFCLTGISFFWKGLWVTNSADDSTGNTFSCLQIEDTKIGIHMNPVSGHGTNQNTFLETQIRINSGAGCTSPPISGTKYLWIDSGSNNGNYFINPELQNNCPQYSGYIDADGNIFSAPRLEANVAGGFTLTSNSHYNSTFSPNLNSGLLSGDVYVDNGANLVVSQWGIVNNAPILVGNPFLHSTTFNVDKDGDVVAGGSVTTPTSIAIQSQANTSGLVGVPVITSCGTSPSLATGSGQLAGQITAGTSPGNICRIDWSNGPFAPHGLSCSASDYHSTGPTYAALAFDVLNSGPSTAVFRGTIGTGDLISYTCTAF